MSPRRGPLALAFLGAAALAGASQVDYGGSNGAFPLLSRGVGARALSLGKAFEALDDDAVSAAWNPATAGWASGARLGLNHEAWLAGTSYENFSGMLPLGGWGGLGLGLGYVAYPAVDLYDAQGQSQGSYQPSEQAFSLAWGLQLASDFSVGFSGKGLRQDLPGAAYYAAAFGLGALWKPARGLGLAATADSQPLSAATGGQKVRGALSFSFGSASALGGPSLAALSVKLDPQAPAELGLGLEKGFFGMESLRLRAGYTANFPSYNQDGLGGLSLGVGFGLGALSLDYAALPFGTFGTTQQFSLNYRFADQASHPGPQAAAAMQGQQAAPPRPAPALSLPQAPVSAAPVQASPPKAVQAGPGEVPRSSAETLYRILSDDYVKGQDLEGEGRFKEAVNAYLAALDKNRDDLPAWKALGLLYERMGRRDYAQRCYREVLRLDPSNELIRQKLNP